MDNYNTYERGQAIDLPKAFSVLMRNVYSWMTGGLLLTAFVALLVANSYEMMYAIASTPALMWGLLIAEFVVAIVFSARIMKMSFAAAAALFVSYAILNGITLSFIFAVYTSESIAQTFFITAGTFALMSLFGYVTKMNLSTMGRALYMLLIGLLIATLVNLFMDNSWLAIVINYAGVVIFVGLTAYDTQKIKNMLMEYSADGVSEQTNKLALLGSLNLYLDFINLFLYMLRFLGNRK